MKNLSFILLIIASSASVIAVPANAEVAAAGVNDAANNGAKGIEAADKAAEAVALVQAGDVGAVTTGAIFSSIDAIFKAKETAAAAPAANTAAAAANAGKADAAKSNAKGDKGKNSQKAKDKAAN